MHRSRPPHRLILSTLLPLVLCLAPLEGAGQVPGSSQVATSSHLYGAWEDRSDELPGIVDTSTLVLVAAGAAAVGLLIWFVSRDDDDEENEGAAFLRPEVANSSTPCAGPCAPSPEPRANVSTGEPLAHRARLLLGLDSHPMVRGRAIVQLGVSVRPF